MARTSRRPAWHVHVARCTFRADSTRGRLFLALHTPGDGGRRSFLSRGICNSPAARRGHDAYLLMACSQHFYRGIAIHQAGRLGHACLSMAAERFFLIEASHFPSFTASGACVHLLMVAKCFIAASPFASWPAKACTPIWQR